MEPERQIEMHVSEIFSIFQKNPGRFMTFRAIADIMEMATWTKFDYLHPALQTMIKRGQLEYDEKCGYCRKGEKAILRAEMAKPSITRSMFDGLPPSEQSAHIKSGGRVVSG